MIIIGYPGIGKTTVAKDDYRFIDLDSSMWKDIKDWAKQYCSIAEYLSSQGYYVFVSTHPEVKNRLIASKERVALCYPAEELKDEWVEKLNKRYKDQPNTKNHDAWKRAADHFEEDIRYMDELGYKKIIIPNMEYNLKRMIVEFFDGDIW